MAPWSALGDEPLSSTARWQPPPFRRGSYQILVECILTLVLCVWTAVHLNIPPSSQGPMASDNRGNKKAKKKSEKVAFNWKKLRYMFLALVAPEIVTFVAFDQWRKQRELLKAIRNTELGGIEDSDPNALKQPDEERADSPQQNGDRELDNLPPEEERPEQHNSAVEQSSRTPIQGGSPPPEAAPDMEYEHEAERPLSASGKRKRYHSWTRTHCWYAVMGGFIIENDTNGFQFPIPEGQRRLILSTDAVARLAQNHPDIFPDLRETAIIDKSKANGLAKTLVCVQAIWFCANLIGRIAQRLPMTVLELNTAAHCICTLVTYGFWWSKPLDITEPTAVSLTREAAEEAALMCLRSDLGCTAVCNIQGKPGSFGERLHSLFRPAFYIKYTCDAPLLPQMLLELTRFGQLTLRHTTGHAPRSTMGYAREYYFNGSLWGRSRGVYAVSGGTRSPAPAYWGDVLVVRHPDLIRDLVYLGCPAKDANGKQILDPWKQFPHAQTDVDVQWVTFAAQEVNLLSNVVVKLSRLVLLFAACGLYAAVHMTAWNGPFRTHAELYLWRMGVLAFIPSTPSFLLLSLIYFSDTIVWRQTQTIRRLVQFWPFVDRVLDVLVNIRDKFRSAFAALPSWIRNVIWAGFFISFGLLLLTSICAFLVGRAFLVVEAFLALPYAPDGAFDLPQWSSYLPHFG